jgi:membrane protein
MLSILRNLYRGLGRVYPDCMTLSQAIAFNMFLAFFPMLLFAIGLVSSTSFFHEALREIPDRLSVILPPGSTDVVAAYFVRKNPHPLRWMLLGLGGTLFAGTQVMLGFIEGFRVIEGDLLRPSHWRLNLRALLLMCLTIVPILAVVVLTVFGKQVRPWLIQYTGLPALVHVLGYLFYASVVFLLAMAVLLSVYRIGRPGHQGYKAVLPGACVATILWWTVDIFFGFYVRKMPYGAVYGGLAAAIGLLLWMYLTAIVVLLGAAYNAEAHEYAIALENEERKPIMTRMFG